jgi:hypothetical protein
MLQPRFCIVDPARRWNSLDILCAKILIRQVNWSAARRYARGKENSIEKLGTPQLTKESAKTAQTYQKARKQNFK